MSKKVIKHVYPRKLGRALARTVLERLSGGLQRSASGKHTVTTRRNA